MWDVSLQAPGAASWSILCPSPVDLGRIPMVRLASILICENNRSYIEWNWNTPYMTQTVYVTRPCEGTIVLAGSKAKHAQSSNSIEFSRVEDPWWNPIVPHQLCSFLTNDLRKLQSKSHEREIVGMTSTGCDKRKGLLKAWWWGRGTHVSWNMIRNAHREGPEHGVLDAEQGMLVPHQAVSLDFKFRASPTLTAYPLGPQECPFSSTLTWWLFLDESFSSNIIWHLLSPKPILASPEKWRKMRKVSLEGSLCLLSSSLELPIFY